MGSPRLEPGASGDVSSARSTDLQKQQDDAAQLQRKPNPLDLIFQIFESLAQTHLQSLSLLQDPSSFTSLEEDGTVSIKPSISSAIESLVQTQVLLSAHGRQSLAHPRVVAQLLETHRSPPSHDNISHEDIKGYTISNLHKDTLQGATCTTENTSRSHKDMVQDPEKIVEDKTGSLHEKTVKDTNAILKGEAALQDEMRKLKEEMELQKSKKKRLEALFIQDHRPDAEPSENRIIEDYQTLRKKVEKVAFDLRKSHTGQLVYGTDGKSYPRRLLRFIASQKIFDILREEVFDKPCFGLNNGLEQCLMHFEQEMCKVNIPQIERANWRKLTVSIATAMNPNPDLNSIQSRVKALIAQFKPQGSTERATPKSPDIELLDICKLALNLALRWRQKQAAYSIRIYERGVEYNEHEMVDVESEQDTTSNNTTSQVSDPKSEALQRRGKQVAFTVFGALVKNTYVDSDDIAKSIVLVEADVVTL